MNRKFRAAALSLAVACLLSACGKKDGAEAEETPALPEEYAFSETVVVPALTTEDTGVQYGVATAVTYEYEGLSDPAGTASNYATDLRRSGFTVVDQEFSEIDPPDFSTAEGSVLLAQDYVPEVPEGSEQEEEAPADQEEQVPQVVTAELNWMENECTVTIDLEEGQVIPAPPPPPSPKPNPMSISEALDYLNTLSPSVLGLSGASMSGYNIYAVDGAVMVDDQACLRMNVYSRGEGGANEFAGVYLLSGDGLHLYQLNEEASTVRELELPPRT